jgi:hypothetical protein
LIQQGPGETPPGRVGDERVRRLGVLDSDHPLLAARVREEPLADHCAAHCSCGRLTTLGAMDDQPIDYEALRKRFPWVGLFDEDWGDLASRYREIMAEALIDRRTVEAIDAVRRSA